MNIEIWSDVVCPWCSIGKRRLEAALEQFDHRDDVEIIWRSFELDPNAPRRRDGDLVRHLATKYGMTHEQAVASQARITAVAADAGLDFHLDHAQPGNTFDAHRLLHLAAVRGVQDEVKERLLAAYVSEGAAIGDPETLVRLAGEAGLDADEARHVLDGDTYTEEVRADEREATRLGVTRRPVLRLRPHLRRLRRATARAPARGAREDLDRCPSADHRPRNRRYGRQLRRRQLRHLEPRPAVPSCSLATRAPSGIIGAVDNMTRLEKIVARLPEAQRVDIAEWGDHPTFRVNGKNFVFSDQEARSLSVKLPKHEADDLVASDPHVEPAGYGLGRHGWIALTLPSKPSAARWKQVEEWVRTSYTLVAPKKLARLVDEEDAVR